MFFTGERYDKVFRVHWSNRSRINARHQICMRTGAFDAASSILLKLIKISTPRDKKMRQLKRIFTFHSKNEILELKGKERLKITSMYHVYSCVAHHPPNLCYLWVRETNLITLTQLSGNLHVFFWVNTRWSFTTAYTGQFEWICYYMRLSTCNQHTELSSSALALNFIAQVGDFLWQAKHFKNRSMKS